MRVSRNLRALKLIVRLIKVMYNFFYHSSEKKKCVGFFSFNCPLYLQDTSLPLFACILLYSHLSFEGFKCATFLYN